MGWMVERNQLQRKIKTQDKPNTRLANTTQNKKAQAGATHGKTHMYIQNKHKTFSEIIDSKS
jgi:hypothetical protein